MRTAHPTASKQEIIERLYVHGALSIDEASRLLDVHPSDLLAAFDACEIARSIDAIRLDTSTRKRRLQAIRADRLRRRGAPEPNDDRVRRDVIASARIEGVDARPWIAGTPRTHKPRRRSGAWGRGGQ